MRYLGLEGGWGFGITGWVWQCAPSYAVVCVGGNVGRVKSDVRQVSDLS